MLTAGDMKEEMLQILENSSMGEKETKSVYTELLNLFSVSHSTAKLLDKLKKEIKEYDRFCFQLFSVRYDDAKPQDAWYDDYLDRYHKAKARIELLTELLE